MTRRETFLTALISDLESRARVALVPSEKARLLAAAEFYKKSLIAR